MYHPMKRLEAKWNAHTPVYLHNRTKENLIFQGILTVCVLFVIYAKDLDERRREAKMRQATLPTLSNHE